MLSRAQAIENLKGEIAILAGHVFAYSRYDKKDEIESFDAWTLWTFRVFESLVTVSLIDKGIEFDDRGLPILSEDFHRNRLIPPVTYAINYSRQYYPLQCVQLMNQLRQRRNEAAHICGITKEALATFLTTFKNITYWFLLESPSLRNDYEQSGVIAAFDQLDKDISLAFLYENQRIILDSAAEMNKKLDLLLEGQTVIKDQLSNIENQLVDISSKITGYQSLVEKQIELASSEEEQEHILHAFSQECIERIMQSFSSNSNKKLYDDEREKLIISIGDSAWSKMEESSKSFLISAKTMYNQFIGMEEIIDYSGICLLVTKALEVEMSKRFCSRFVAYLKSKYPGKVNYVNYPTTLLDKYGKPVKAKHFTLGSVPYVLGFYVADDITPAQLDNNKKKLEEYAKSELFANSPDIDVLDTLKVYGGRVDEIKERYRNPSAHTNEMSRVSAVECFGTVIDVEKLLKKMLDSFDR